MAAVAFVRTRTLPRIRHAWPHEAPALGALAARAKATWGYAPAEMAVFEGELRIAPESLGERRAFVLEAFGRLAGFYTLAPREVGTVELEHLFVEPALMGRGFGSRLLEHAREQARRAGYARMLVQSDPHAERFYRLRGAARLRLIPSSVPGRTLPLLEVLL